MEVEYVYTKKRSEFGRQCLFAESGTKLLEDVIPNKELLQQYVLENPVHRGTQLSKEYAEHEASACEIGYG